MTTLDLLSGIPILSMIVAVIWAIRLEGRVSSHELVCSERYRRLEERHVEALDAIRALDAKFDRVVNK
jgi:hypothetical protein